MERSAVQRQSQAPLVAKGVTVSAELPDCTGAIVVANELLDNIPFRVIQRTDDGLAEWFVAEESRTVLEPVETVPTTVVDALVDAEAGTAVPWLEGAARWVESVLTQHPRSLLVLDYGAKRTAELAVRNNRWLRTFARHHRGHDPYASSGRTDITTDVAFDQLPGDPSLDTQAAFLAGLGIQQLVAEGAERWRQEAARPTLGSIEARSRTNEAAALCDPRGLGAFLVAHWRTA